MDVIEDASSAEGSPVLHLLARRVMQVLLRRCRRRPAGSFHRMMARAKRQAMRNGMVTRSRARPRRGRAPPRAVTVTREKSRPFAACPPRRRCRRQSVYAVVNARPPPIRQRRRAAGCRMRLFAPCICLRRPPAPPFEAQASVLRHMAMPPAAQHACVPQRQVVEFAASSQTARRLRPAELVVPSVRFFSRA